ADGLVAAVDRPQVDDARREGGGRSEVRHRDLLRLPSRQTRVERSRAVAVRAVEDDEAGRHRLRVVVGHSEEREAAAARTERRLAVVVDEPASTGGEPGE